MTALSLLSRARPLGLCLELQSWLCGKILEYMDPAAVALGSSRGYESASSKRVMRLTVLAADLIGKKLDHCSLNSSS